MIVILAAFIASFVVALGLSFLLAGVLLERSNSYGSKKESSPSMKRFMVSDVNQKKI